MGQRWLAGFLTGMMLMAGTTAPSAERMSKKAAELESSELEASESIADVDLGEQTRAVVNVSVANVRLTPRHRGAKHPGFVGSPGDRQ